MNVPLTEDQQTLVEIQTTIARLPPRDQATITAWACHFTDLLTAGGQPATVAFALVGARIAAQT